VKWNFVKIWIWHVENNHNYHRLHPELFHYSYHNIIVNDGKFIISNLQMNSFFERKIFILSMWKLTQAKIYIIHKQWHHMLNIYVSQHNNCLSLFLFFLGWNLPMISQQDSDNSLWNSLLKGVLNSQIAFMILIYNNIYSIYMWYSWIHIDNTQFI
jgi:hypothetical protein